VVFWGFLGGFFYCQPWRKEPERGIATLDLMREWGAAPDILTFGCLALCCTSYKEAARLMADLKARGCLRNLIRYNSLDENVRNVANSKKSICQLRCFS
jgi:hypothetical protein